MGVLSLQKGSHITADVSTKTDLKILIEINY